MNKRDIYWQARMMADEKRAHAIAGNASKEINGMYRRQYLKIVKQMELLSAQIDRGGTLTRTQLWNYSRWKELERLLSGFVSEATKINTDKVHEALDEVFKNTIGSGTEEFVSGRPQLQTAAVNVIDTDWSGSNYSSRIWHNQAAIADSIKNSMEDMLIQGRGLPDIKKRLMREFGVAFNDADRLVRTEAAYVLNRAAVARYKNANLQKIRWSTGPEDGNECEICAARNNKVYRIGEEPMIPAHPRCRCIYVGVVELPGEDVEVDGPQLETVIDENGGKLPKKPFVLPNITGERINDANVIDVTRLYEEQAQSGVGEVIYGYGYATKHHEDEIKRAYWIKETYGGNITLLPELEKWDKKTPDYLWRGKMWELKAVTSKNSVDKNTQKALHQIADNPGGIIIDCKKSTIDLNEIEDTIKNRLRRDTKQIDLDIMIVSDQKTIKVLRYEKARR